MQKTLKRGKMSAAYWADKGLSGKKMNNYEYIFNEIIQKKAKKKKKEIFCKQSW